MCHLCAMEGPFWKIHKSAAQRSGCTEYPFLLTWNKIKHIFSQNYRTVTAVTLKSVSPAVTFLYSLGCCCKIYCSAHEQQENLCEAGVGDENHCICMKPTTLKSITAAQRGRNVWPLQVPIFQCHLADDQIPHAVLAQGDWR